MGQLWEAKGTDLSPPRVWFSQGSALGKGVRCSLPIPAHLTLLWEPLEELRWIKGNGSWGMSQEGNRREETCTAAFIQ